MLPPLLAQAVDKKSSSPSVEAHRKGSPNLYGRALGIDYCFACAVGHNGACHLRPSLWRPFSCCIRIRFSSVTRTRTPRRFHSRYDAGRELKESSFERALLVERR